MHHPVDPYKCEDGLDPESVQKLQTLFANYTNVSYVVAGHEHMYYNPLGKGALVLPPSRTDPTIPAIPPYYLVSGGAGAPLKKNTTGSFFHYIVFQVNGCYGHPDALGRRVVRSVRYGKMIAAGRGGALVYSEPS